MNPSVPILSVRGERPWFLHPAVIFYGTWLGVWFLYSLRLSDVLIFSSSTVSRLELPILLGFFPLLLATKLLPIRRFPQIAEGRQVDISTLLDKKLRFWFRLWIALTIFEIIVSGGVPLVWTLTGSSKDYFMFGIPTLHGLLNALILAISITRFTLGLRNGRRRDLLFPLFLIAWSLFIVFARQLTIVVALECAFLFLMYRKLQLKRVLGVAAAALAFITLFGIAGDLRTGGDAFRQLARPTDRYPDWLPSGFLWVYMYMTTPLNNLINTWATVPASGDITMPNTLSQLIPTAIRNLGAKVDVTTWQGNLVTDAFNVSTAYVGPVQDLGLWGIAAFSSFAGFTTGIYWLQRGMRSNLIFAVLGQCLFLTIFLDHFLFLPIIAQIPWIYVLFRGNGGYRSYPNSCLRGH